MKHLGEQVTDFVFGELSASDMDEARSHIAGCAECRREVEQFERTRSMLKMSPDVEPPRHIVFEFEKSPASWRRWFVPSAAAAAVIIAVWIAAPIGVQWRDSQLTIAVGRMPAAPAPIPASTVATASAPQPIDYDRITKAIQDSQQAWVMDQLKLRDDAQAKEIARLRGELAYVDGIQRAMYRETQENASSIQMLAQSKGGDSRD